jgi:hypothetical protein
MSFGMNGVIVRSDVKRLHTFTVKLMKDDMSI